MSLDRNADLQAATLRVWKPFVLWLLKGGIAYGGALRLLKIAYALAGDELAGRRGPGDKVNAAKIATMTGLKRHEVGDLLREAHGSGALGRVHAQTRAQRVLWGWHNDPAFKNPDGTPSRLRLEGPKSFRDLVRKYSGGIPAETCLRALLNSGAVRKRSDERLQVMRRTYATAHMDAAGIAAFAEALTDRLGALLHNADTANGSELYSRRIVSGPLDQDSAALLMNLIRNRADTFGSGIEDEVSDAGHAPRAQSSHSLTRALVFTMFVSQADEEESDTDSAPEPELDGLTPTAAVPKPSKRRRRKPVLHDKKT